MPARSSLGAVLGRGGLDGRPGAEDGQRKGEKADSVYICHPRVCTAVAGEDAMIGKCVGEEPLAVAEIDIEALHSAALSHLNDVELLDSGVVGIPSV